MNNIYQKLTQRFNVNKQRAIISSGQAAVLHRLAIMSKDGDWIIKEDSETTEHILTVLSKYGAKYRFGAPLDIRWLSHGWSSHFEFYYRKLRIRTDFCTRPPRISESGLENIWAEQKDSTLPFVDAVTLAEIKKTNREKDYVIIGELARLMANPREQILYSRSAGDLTNLANEYPEITTELIATRPMLKKIAEGRDAIEQALDAERRALIHTNEERLKAYIEAAQKWLDIWPDIQKKVYSLSLVNTHKTIIDEAQNVLPFSLEKRGTI